MSDVSASSEGGGNLALRASAFSDEHAYTCEREMGRLRNNRAKLSDAQTFAFGQHGQIDDSPTAPNRSKTVGGDLMMTEMSSSMV
jgi:M-phase inducer tyrosine phosphatase